MKMKKFVLLTAWVAVTLGLVFWLLASVRALETEHSREGRQQLENAVRQAAVACYAAEGIYPPNLEYMTKYYGLQIQKDRYSVFYEVFADNLMPDITVLEKE